MEGMGHSKFRRAHEMLEKVARDARDWNLTDAMMEDVLTIGDTTELVGELVEYFAGTSDFDEELFDFCQKWAGRFIEENDEEELFGSRN